MSSTYDDFASAPVRGRFARSALRRPRAFRGTAFDKTVARRRYQSTDREYDKRAHFKRRQEVEPQLHGSHEYDGVLDVERIAVFPHAGEESREWQGAWFLLLKVGAALAAALCGYM
jgi:hypothetical protein